MIGISYLTGKEAQLVKQRIKRDVQYILLYECILEETLYEKRKMIVPARVVDEADVVEINTFEQLRELDSGCDQLKTDAIQIIEEVFQVSQKDIKNITVLKKGNDQPVIFI